MEIKELLNQYKEATDNFIEIVENDYKSAQKYVEIREKCLKKLGEGNFNKAEVKRIYNELELEKYDKEALRILKQEKEKVNIEIVKLKRNKDASQMYNRSFKNINFLNKRI